jgi:hypothetical protein
MGESNDERLANLKNILSKYNTVDQQYIADRLSDLINTNYKDVDFNLTYRDISTDSQLKNYLNDKVYKGILFTITDLKEYRALQKSLFQNNPLNNSQINNKLPSKSKAPGSGQLNAQFNTAFIQQVDKNNMDKLLEEEKALSQMMQIEPQPEKKIKLFHTLTFAEIVDNLANSTVILFKQIYSFDVNGLMTSYDNYIYYGIIFIFIYIILRMVWQELEN